MVGANNQGDALRIISTMTNRGKVRWKVFEGAMHAGLLIDFSKWLIKDADRKVVLVLDDLKVHPALTVKAWLADCEEQIEVFCLPGAQLRSRTVPRRTSEWRTDGNAD